MRWWVKERLSALPRFRASALPRFRACFARPQRGSSRPCAGLSPNPSFPAARRGTGAIPFWAFSRPPIQTETTARTDLKRDSRERLRSTTFLAQSTTSATNSRSRQSPLQALPQEATACRFSNQSRPAPKTRSKACAATGVARGAAAAKTGRSSRSAAFAKSSWASPAARRAAAQPVQAGRLAICVVKRSAGGCWE